MIKIWKIFGHLMCFTRWRLIASHPICVDQDHKGSNCATCSLVIACPYKRKLESIFAIQLIFINVATIMIAPRVTYNLPQKRGKQRSSWPSILWAPIKCLRVCHVVCDDWWYIKRQKIHQFNLMDWSKDRMALIGVAN